MHIFELTIAMLSKEQYTLIIRVLFLNWVQFTVRKSISTIEGKKRKDTRPYQVLLKMHVTPTRKGGVPNNKSKQKVIKKK